MQHRRFGRTGFEISQVSLSALSIPTAARKGSFDPDARADAIRYAIDNGANFINLGYPQYFDDPQAAADSVRASLEGRRDKVKLAITVPTAFVKTRNELEEGLKKQLDLFGLDHVDFCVMDRISRFPWNRLKKAGLDSWCDSVLERGIADHMALIFHDDAYYLEDINQYYPKWDMIQMEYSFLDHKHHPGMGGLKFTEQYDLGVIATDVLKNGRVLKNIPSDVQSIWDSSSDKRSVAEWGIRWTLSQKEISSAMFDFENIEQAKTYMDIADTVTPGCVRVMEQVRATKAREAYYDNAREIRCTACRCCMPCEFGVDVPRVVELYNDAVMFGEDDIPRFMYNLERHRDTPCHGCTSCETVCPRHYPLMEILEKAKEHFPEY